MEPDSLGQRIESTGTRLAVLERHVEQAGDRGGQRDKLLEEMSAILGELRQEHEELSTARELRQVGENTRLADSLQDITERKRAEETLEQRVLERTGELAQANADLQAEIHERKRAEEAAKAERQRFYDILEILPAYLVLLTPDYHVPFANRFFRERFGESYGRRCFEYLFGRGEPCEACETYKVLKTRAPLGWEWTGPDDRNYDVHDFAFTDTDGSPLILEMGIDITERKQAEKALREAHDELEQRVRERTAQFSDAMEELQMAEEELRQQNEELVESRALVEAERQRYVALFDFAPDGYLVTDPQGTIREANRAAAEMLRVSQEALVGKPLAVFMTQEGQGDLWLTLAPLVQRGQVQDYAVRVQPREGLPFYAAISARAVESADGRTTGMRWLIHDITERKRAEQALRETRDYLDNLLTYANAPIIVWDPDFHITRFNTAFERLTGLKAGDVHGKTLDILFPQDRREEAMAHIRRAATGERWEVVEIPIRHVDGTVRTVLWNSATLYAADGTTVVATIAQGQDITERKRAEETIRQQNAVLDSINRVFTEALACETEEDIARVCLAIAEQVTGSRFGFIGEINAEGRMVDIAISDPGWEACRVANPTGHETALTTFPIHGIYGRVLLDGKGFFTNDLASHPDTIGTPEGHPALEAFLGVPLIQQNETIGMIAVANREGGYRDEDLAALEALAEPMVQVLMRHRAEQALQESEQRFRLVLENAPIVAANLDRDLRYTWIFNPRGGFSAEAVLGKPVGLSTDPQATETIVKSLRQVLDNGASVHWEAMVKANTGEMFFESHAEPLRSAGGEIEGIALVSIDITERKRAEEVILRAKEEWECTFDSIPDLIAILDNEQHVQRANRAMAERLGLVPEQCVGQVCYRCVHALDGSPAFCPHPLTVADGREHTAEVHEPRLGGHFVVSTTPLRDPQGRVSGVVHVARDITERKQAEQELRETRDYLDNLLTYANAPIIVWDPDFHITRFNTAFERLTGLKAGDVYGKTLDILFPQDQREEAMAHIRRAAAGERWEVVEIPIRHVDGTVRIVLWNSATLYAADGATVVATIAQGQDITERKRAEQALRETRDYLDNLLTYANAPIIVWDADFHITRFNTAFERLTGLKAGDVHGKTLDILFPGDRREEAMAHIRRAATGERWEVVEIPIRHVDGTVRTLLWNSATLYAADGATVVATIAQGQDITERKQAQQALQRYADRLRGLHEADQAILAAQLSVEEIATAAIQHMPQLLDCVRTSVTLFDYEAQEASLLAVYTRGETRLKQGWRGPLYTTWPGMLDVLARGETYVVEDLQEYASSSVIQALRSEGVRAYAHFPLIMQGQLVGSLSLGMGIPGPLSQEQQEVALEMATHVAIGIQQARLHEQVQRHAEELEKQVAERTAALQASEARFRTVFEEAAIGIALVDLEGRYMASNVAFQEMLGYSGEELRGLPFAQITYPEDLAADMRLFEGMVAGERDSYRIEKRYVRKDGQVRWANRVFSLVRDADGAPQYAISMIEDITERKQALDALLRTEKLTVAGRLAASLAHEINNPLQSVIGCLALADETLAEGGDVSRYLQVARGELKRVASSVAQLRDLHRQPVLEEKKPTDMQALVGKVLTLTSKQCATNHVEVECKVGKGLSPVPLSADRIQQVFLNLILNALDAMPEGGQLRVSVARTRGPAGVRVTFADTGKGIPARDLLHVFEPFYSTKPTGLGLGLFISQGIVKQHGGSMEVDSQEGKGTTFRVWLPAQV